MGFWLKKLIGFWLMPLPTALALLAVGLLLLRRDRASKWGRRLVVTGAVWLLVFSNNAVGTWLVRTLESRHAPIPELALGAPLPAELARCRFIVVLGGGHGDMPGLSATGQLSTSALGRVVEGARLAHALPAARLITTGPRNFPDRPDLPTHAHVLATAAVSLGVDVARTIEVPDGRDTEDEAQTVLATAGRAPVALVTSAWHMPRAYALFQKAGVDVIACPADFLARTGDEKKLGDFGWDVTGLERSGRAIREYVGFVWVRLRGKA